MKNPKLSSNSVSLAGEFAVLSRLALWGYDANMTLGRTKNVDILVSDPRTNKFYQLEVKTNIDRRNGPSTSKLFGRFLTEWIMSEKHETIARPELWYCFVSINLETKIARYFVVPSAIVATYVKAEHGLWLDQQPGRKDNAIRMFRLGFEEEQYKVPTAAAKKYEDNWEFSTK